jgi:hypothetical protein
MGARLEALRAGEPGRKPAAPHPGLFGVDRATQPRRPPPAPTGTPRTAQNGQPPYFRMILANDDRPRTMHASADRTDRELLPPLVAALLDRNDQRRAARRAAWQQHNAQARAREAANERLSQATRDTAERAAERQRCVGGDSLELLNDGFTAGSNPAGD